MIISTNKRAYFDYQILETYEAGIELFGFEVKSVKSGRINLAGSYVIIRPSSRTKFTAGQNRNEVWLLNADIPAYQPKNAPQDYDSKRTRRLLLKKPEIKNLIGRAQEKGLTLIPLKVYTKNRKIKIEIGLAKSRKKMDKRELIKKRDIEKEIGRNL
jgi:SsrA-binding protein